MKTQAIKITCSLLLALLAGGCASGRTLPGRPDLSSYDDPAHRVKLFYEYRLNEGKGGYWVKWSKGDMYFGDRDLPAFFEKNRDDVAAGWAKNGNRMTWAGWILGLGLESAAIAVSAGTRKSELKWAWAYAVLPAAMLAWVYDWMGDKWFRLPAVDHYNRELKRELNVDAVKK